MVAADMVLVKGRMGEDGSSVCFLSRWEVRVVGVVPVVWMCPLTPALKHCDATDIQPFIFNSTSNLSDICITNSRGGGHCMTSG